MSPADEDGFLGRWSRLKRAAEQPEPVAAPDPGPEPQPPIDPEPAPLTDEELAALPRIEDLAEGSGIRAFLRAGVPRDLRNAALRRIWMLTPAVRDYRDPAVDYAWDWNTPGGVPGDGVAPSAESAARMLHDLITPRPAHPEAEPAVGEGSAPTAGAPELAATDSPADDAPTDTHAPDGDPHDPDGAEGVGTAEGRSAALPDDPPDPLPPRRRHGSALPG